jgi:chorismate synthase
MIRFVSAGESHGKQLTAILEGIPAGLPILASDINTDLARRQKGFGRGGRMKIESDTIEFLAGVRDQETTGAPICLVVKNLDWVNWEKLMSPQAITVAPADVQTKPRPGHADLPGVLKYDREDIRDILERASARETAMRVAVGAVCKKFLSLFGVAIGSFVTEIGGLKAGPLVSLEAAIAAAENSEVHTHDQAAQEKMKDVISKAAQDGDTLGGVFTVAARGVVAGLGSHTQWDKKLDGQIAQALMSVQAIKGVELGSGFATATLPGSKVHDEILFFSKRGFYRNTNNAGGVEGGISNGEDVVVSCAMKPIPSLKKPLKSVDIRTKTVVDAEAVRSDVCAVPAAAVVGEAALAIALAAAYCEKFGGDSMKETLRNYHNYRQQIAAY